MSSIHPAKASRKDSRLLFSHEFGSAWHSLLSSFTNLARSSRVSILSICSRIFTFIVALEFGLTLRLLVVLNLSVSIAPCTSCGVAIRTRIRTPALWKASNRRLSMVRVCNRATLVVLAKRSKPRAGGWTFFPSKPDSTAIFHSLLRVCFAESSSPDSLASQSPPPLRRSTSFSPILPVSASPVRVCRPSLCAPASSPCMRSAS
jgi:hypothetical protein